MADIVMPSDEREAEAGRDYPFPVRWSKECEDALESIPIFLRHFRSVHNVYEWGQTVWFGGPCRIERDATLPPGRWWPMGAHSYCDGAFSGGDAIVGRYCSIAKNCGLMGDDHPTSFVTTSHITYADQFGPISQQLYGKSYEAKRLRVWQLPITVGNDVWIGQDVLFKGGITIGDGAVIAARAVVTKDVPPYAIVGGVPARTIRMRFDDETIAQFQSVAWWRFNYPDLPRCWDEPDRFLDELERMISDGSIQELPAKRYEIGRILLRASLGLSIDGPELVA